MAVVCLITIGTSRDFRIKETNSDKRIIKRLIDCIPNIEKVDSVPGNFNLNLNVFEFIAPLETSFGPMDFVSLPLADSIWINKLFLEKKIDITVCYRTKKGVDGDKYIPHCTFPDFSKLEAYFLEDRKQEFSKAYDSMVQKSTTFTFDS